MKRGPFQLPPRVFLQELKPPGEYMLSLYRPPDRPYIIHTHRRMEKGIVTTLGVCCYSLRGAKVRAPTPYRGRQHGRAVFDLTPRTHLPYSSHGYTRRGRPPLSRSSASRSTVLSGMPYSSRMPSYRAICLLAVTIPESKAPLSSSNWRSSANTSFSYSTTRCLSRLTSPFCHSVSFTAFSARSTAWAVCCRMSSSRRCISSTCVRTLRLVK
mmetsp:Transcript_11636/g.42551  ORF Transcript_11636/g.42551 Transcript_11636/m.42551 type:complete len:212 (-) Transcript_11636:330-965(-)